MGKKGLKTPIEWNPKACDAFENLKSALAAELDLFQMDVDRPYVMRSDASDWAIGAVLEQEFGGSLKPVAFYSRKLSGSQLNWTPREKECYAIVSSLRKWAGWIGFQPIVIKTDHRSLEEWVNENIDTPSGPRGRKARWHETLSQFRLEVQYIPGKENVVADAMSRWAYPATSAREDVSFHGSWQAKEDVRKMLQKEKQEERDCATPQGRPKENVAPSHAPNEILCDNERREGETTKRTAGGQVGETPETQAYLYEEVGSAPGVSEDKKRGGEGASGDRESRQHGRMEPETAEGPQPDNAHLPAVHACSRSPMESPQKIPSLSPCLTDCLPSGPESGCRSHPWCLTAQTNRRSRDHRAGGAKVGHAAPANGMGARPSEPGLSTSPPESTRKVPCLDVSKPGLQPCPASQGEPLP